MAPRGDIDYEARLRIAQWLRWYRRRKRHQYRLDKDFAEHVDITAGHLSSVLTYANSGGVNGRAPGMDVLIKLSDAANVRTDEILRDPAPTEEVSANGGHDRSPTPAPRATRRPGGRRSGGGQK